MGPWKKVSATRYFAILGIYVKFQEVHSMNIQQICFNTSADLGYHRLSIEPPMEPACLCDASLVRSICERSAISQEHQEKTLSHHLSEKITDRSLGYFRSFLLLSQLNDFPGNKDMATLHVCFHNFNMTEIRIILTWISCLLWGSSQNL